MTLTVRSATVTGATTKGSALTHAELDENFNHLSQASNHTFTPSGTGAVAETVESRGRWDVRLTDFMSVADRASIRAGSTVDVTTALTNAIAALPNSKGIVLLPQGELKITSAITLAIYQGLVGQGMASNTGADGATSILKNGNFDGITCGSHGILKNFSIRGDTGNGGDGIVVNGANADLESVGSHDHGGVGWRFGDKAAAGGLNANAIGGRNLRASGNTSHGFYWHDANSSGGPNANAGFFINLTALSNGGDGVRFDDCIDNAIFGLLSESNTGYGARFVAGAKGNYIFAPYFEANTAGNLILDASSIENVVFGARNGTADSYTDNGTRNTVVGRDNAKQGDLIWKKLWAVEAYISNASFTGRLQMKQTANDTYKLAASGGTPSYVDLVNDSGSMRFKVNGTSGYYRGCFAKGGTINHGTVGANAVATATLTVTGARDQMKVIANPRQAAGLPAGLVHAYTRVSANDTVEIAVGNLTGVGVACNIAWTVAVLDINDDT